MARGLAFLEDACGLPFRQIPFGTVGIFVSFMGPLRQSHGLGATLLAALGSS